jgi:AcrR family transcriptional regulator
MDLAVEPSATCVGNLRQRAIQAAHRLLEAHGEAGLGLRAIAAEIGTGVGSLYYHFANKDELMAELAVDGFRELSRWMTLAGQESNGRTAGFNCGHAYLGFTRHRPGLYALMYNERILATQEVARRAEAEAFAVFKQSIDSPVRPAADIEDVALTYWALGRGMASISASLGAPSPGAAKTMARRVLRGLDLLISESARALA